MLLRHMAAAAMGLMLVTTTVAAQPPAHHPKGSVNAREHRQKARIKDGVKDGELTRAEKEKLAADEAQIRAEERLYRKTGDGLNKRERRDLQRDLNKTSREIYRAKHNERKPK